MRGNEETQCQEENGRLERRPAGKNARPTRGMW